MMANISKTFSIDQKIYDKFEQICDSKRINKSKILQDYIKTFIGENYDIDKDMFYKLRHISNSEVVKIESKDKDFIILSNGNKMNIFDFEMLYEEEDLGVAKVMNYFGYTEDVDQVDPEELFDGSCSLNPDMLKKAFEKVDITKVKDTRETVHYREITHENDVLTKDNRTMEEKVAELKEKHMIEELREKCSKERDFIKDFNKQQFMESLGTLKVETPVEEFLNQSSINPEKFREILETIDTEKIETPENNGNGPWGRRIVKENGEDIYNQSFKPANTINDNKEEIIEEISIDEKKLFVGRIKEHKMELYTKLTIERLTELLIYVFNTNVKIEELTLISEKTKAVKKMYLIFIPKKYHGYVELENIISRNFEKHEYRNVEETPICEKIKEKIAKINASDFLNIGDKRLHLSDMLNKILDGIAPTDVVSVIFEEPLYTILIPRKYICGEILGFIYSYGINPDCIIIENSDAKI